MFLLGCIRTDILQSSLRYSDAAMVAGYPEWSIMQSVRRNSRPLLGPRATAVQVRRKPLLDYYSSSECGGIRNLVDDSKQEYNSR